MLATTQLFIDFLFPKIRLLFILGFVFLSEFVSLKNLSILSVQHYSGAEIKANKHIHFSIFPRMIFS